MKAIKLVTMAVVAFMALGLTSCTKNIQDPVVGDYTVISDITVNRNEGSGIIYYQMRDAVINAARGADVRSEATDKAVIAAADVVAHDYKDQANKKVVLSVVFQPGNAMGEAEKKPTVLKSYTFVPVD